MQLTHYRQQAPDFFSGLSQLHRELDRMFDFGHERWPAPFRSFGLLEGPWTPAVDVYEDKDKIRVRAEVPGLKKDDIDLTIQGNTLILKGERKQEFDEKAENHHRVERVYGRFHRAIGLPSPVNPSEIKATYTDGILEVVLPKKEEAKPRQITVDVN